MDIKVVQHRDREGDREGREGVATGQRRTRARQIESQSERGRRDEETAYSGECERKERAGE